MEVVLVRFEPKVACGLARGFGGVLIVVFVRALLVADRELVAVVVFAFVLVMIFVTVLVVVLITVLVVVLVAVVVSVVVVGTRRSRSVPRISHSQCSPLLSHRCLVAPSSWRS